MLECGGNVACLMLQYVPHAPHSADQVLECRARLGKVDVGWLEQAHEFMVVDSDSFRQEGRHGSDGGKPIGLALCSDPEKPKARYELVHALIGSSLKAHHVRETSETRLLLKLALTCQQHHLGD